MQDSDTSYHLNSEKLDDAIAVVSGENEQLSLLVAMQRRSSRGATLVASVFFALLFGLLILTEFSVLSSPTGIVLVCLFMVVFVTSFLILVRKELSALKRLRQTQRALGLEPEKYFQFAGLEEWRWRIVKTLPAVLLFLIGVGSTVAGFAFDRSWIRLAGMSMIFLGTFWWAAGLTKRNLFLFEQRLITSQKLRRKLIDHRKSIAENSAGISVSEDEYKEVGRIERALVNLERQRAINENAKKTKAPELFVQQSPAVVESKASLEPEVRLRVQTCIDELSTDPYPAGAHESPDGSWQVPVAGTSIRIAYALVAQPKRILLQSLLLD